MLKYMLYVNNKAILQLGCGCKYANDPYFVFQNDNGDGISLCLHHAKELTDRLDIFIKAYNLLDREGNNDA